MFWKTVKIPVKTLVSPVAFLTLGFKKRVRYIMLRQTPFVTNCHSSLEPPPPLAWLNLWTAPKCTSQHYDCIIRRVANASFMKFCSYFATLLTLLSLFIFDFIKKTAAAQHRISCHQLCHSESAEIVILNIFFILVKFKWNFTKTI